MRENYRNSIASINKFPQFTTMNVIDGQAGLIICASLIFNSLTIDNILNIIVLLILAGISISMLSGDNSILSRATNAKTKSDEAQIKERIQLAYHSALIGGQGNYTKNTLMEKLKNEFETDYDVDDSDDTNWILSAKGQIVTIPAGIKENEIILSAIDIKNNGSNYYGQTVNYSVNVNSTMLNNWKIFYADESNIFLIAGDFIPVETLPTEATGLTTKNKYNGYWSSAPSAQIVTSELITSFKWEYWTNYTSYGNGKYVSTLLNTNNWSNFVDTNYADYAIGGSTLEMYCESWNTKNPSEPLYCNNVNSNGYRIGTTDVPTTSNINMSNSEGYSDELYYPHQLAYDGCLGYWIASPNSADRSRVMWVRWSGEVEGIGGSTSYIGFRPVIRLKTGIALKKGTDGFDYNCQIN